MGCNEKLQGAFGAQLSFQYPLRVEVGCNTLGCPVKQVCLAVSVPSTGRSGLQPCWRAHDRNANSCFSTLYGSKWVATAVLPASIYYGQGFSTLYGSKWVATIPRMHWDGRRFGFQYPLRVEVGCNTPNRKTHSALSSFQYPLRVEVGCNDVVRWIVLRDNLVSVPSTGRSGLQLSRGRGCLVTAIMFQYPLRVEVGCNLVRPATSAEFL